MWATATTALDHRDTDLSRDKIMLKIIAFSDLLTATTPACLHARGWPQASVSLATSALAHASAAPFVPSSTGLALVALAERATARPSWGLCGRRGTKRALPAYASTPACLGLPMTTAARG